ncbi:hypothetical protein HDV01_001441 [Terramyces sp. JEL0728]|nr:hypothetical protein HDV01_001441 [Terramyces sp. JEL0728]
MLTNVTVSVTKLALHSTLQEQVLLCQVSAIGQLMTGGMGLAGHLILALDRYMVLVKRDELKPWVFNSILLFFAGILVMVSFGQLTSPRLFESVENGTVCWYPTAPLNETIFGILAFAYFIFVLLIVVVLYTLIYLQVKHRIHKMTMFSTKITQGIISKTEEFQNRLLIRCLTITGAFCLLYIPIFIVIAYRYVTIQNAPQVLELVGDFILVLDGSLCSPLIIIYTNPKYQKEISRYLPISFATESSEKSEVESQSLPTRVSDYF